VPQSQFFRWLCRSAIELFKPLFQAPPVIGNHAGDRSIHLGRTGLYAAASAKHIESGSPGTPQSGNNLQGTRQLLEGACPITFTRAQCQAQGLEPGNTVRADGHPNIAINAKDFTRKRQACINAGYGRDQKTLNYCMATAVYIDESDNAD
jgi:hypothetical protein